jgi:hypothetical protein
MIEGLVKDAVKRAISRDIAAAMHSKSKLIPTGLTLEDITDAFDALYAEQKLLNHDDTIDEYANAPNTKYIDMQKTK